MIADMLSNKNPEQIVTELFTKGRKSSPSHAFITQSFFFQYQEIHATRYIIMKITSKLEFPEIGFNHSSDIDFKEFTKNVLQDHILV